MQQFTADFKEACERLKREALVPEFMDFPEHKRTREKAAFMLETIIEANNGEWQAKIGDTSQPKWYPFFEIIEDDSTPRGFRLSVACVGYDDDCTNLGARLACKSRDLAEFMGENCTELYTDALS